MKNDGKRVMLNALGDDEESLRSQLADARAEVRRLRQFVWRLNQQADKYGLPAALVQEMRALAATGDVQEMRVLAATGDFEDLW